MCRISSGLWLSTEIYSACRSCQVPNLAFFDCGRVRLMLEQVNEDGERFNSLLYYKVEDIHAAYDALQGKGVGFEADSGAPHKIADMEDHELWMAFFRDSERNLVGIMCEKRN